MGGKSRTWKQICAFLNSVRKPGQTYLEPFVGGAWVLQGMTGNRIASDANRALITMYKALQKGWIPPTTVSEDEYATIKAEMDEDDPITAFAGFGCSFGGKWFGGYARGEGRNWANEAHTSLLKKSATFAGVQFSNLKYQDHSPVGCLVYCDPPYSQTTGYGAVGTFDSVLFWDAMRDWSTSNTVVVSEYTAPSDFECVKEMQVKTDMNTKGNQKQPRIEKLFMHHSIAVLPSVVQGSLF